MHSYYFSIERIINEETQTLEYNLSCYISLDLDRLEKVEKDIVTAETLVGIDDEGIEASDYIDPDDYDYYMESQRAVSGLNLRLRFSEELGPFLLKYDEELDRELLQTVIDSYVQSGKIVEFLKRFDAKLLK